MKYREQSTENREQSTESRVQSTKNREYTDKKIRRRKQLRLPKSYVVSFLTRLYNHIGSKKGVDL